MSKTNPKAEAKGDINQPKAKIKSKFERIEPDLFRYLASGVYYSALKRDGKTTWKNLRCTDKPTARRIRGQDCLRFTITRLLHCQPTCPRYPRPQSFARSQ
jgi:hypothetical protein